MRSVTRRVLTVGAVTGLALAAVASPAVALPDSPAIAPVKFPAKISVTVPPGGTGTLTSPALPSGAKTQTISVGDSVQDAENELRAILPTLSNGKKLLTCAAIGDRALEVAEELEDYEGIGITPAEQILYGKALMEMCFQVVAELARAGQAAAFAPSTRASACPVALVAIPVSLTKSASGYTLTATSTARPATKGPLKISCKEAGNTLTFTMKSRSKTKSLRSYVGPTLNVGLQSPETSTQGSTATVTFGQPR